VGSPSKAGSRQRWSPAGYQLLTASISCILRPKLLQAAFRQFICDLREELLRLEFDYYDWKHQVGGCSRKNALAGSF